MPHGDAEALKPPAAVWKASAPLRNRLSRCRVWRLGHEANQSGVSDRFEKSHLQRRATNDRREIRTPNLLIWGQTRCRCAIQPMRLLASAEVTALAQGVPRARGQLAQRGTPRRLLGDEALCGIGRRYSARGAQATTVIASVGDGACAACARTHTRGRVRAHTNPHAHAQQEATICSVFDRAAGETPDRTSGWYLFGRGRRFLSPCVSRWRGAECAAKLTRGRCGGGRSYMRRGTETATRARWRGDRGGDTPCGTRIHNLRIRGPTPCPLGQGGSQNESEISKNKTSKNYL